MCKKVLPYSSTDFFKSMLVLDNRFCTVNVSFSVKASVRSKRNANSYAGHKNQLFKAVK